MTNSQYKNVTVVTNPLIEHNLTILRDKNTDSVRFRQAISLLSTLLSFEATKNLPLKEIEIETPICKTKSKIVDDSYEVIISPILRSGIGISDYLQNILPFGSVIHLGMARNETTFEPIWYYNKLNKFTFKNLDKTLVYLCDPMLATGGTIVEAIKLYVDTIHISQKNIVFLNIISAPEGIKKVNNLYPDIQIYTTAIDEKLNEKKYIVPGLGDAGDRIFNTL